MEGEGDVKPDTPRIGKRPLGVRTSSGGDTQPRKLKPSPKLSPSAVNSYFQMESRVHDVEEHFRRSFQQMSNKPHPLQPSPTSGSDIAMVTNSETHQDESSSSPEQHEVATPSPEQTTSVSSPSESSESGSHPPEEPINVRVASSPTLVSPQQQGASPPLLFSLPSGSLATDSLKSIKSYNEVLSLAAAQQLLTAASLGQSVGGSSGRSLIYPNILPVSQSNLIPVVDSNGVTQLMASPATHSSTLPQPPIVFLGPGGIPLLPAATAQTGMYLVNTPSTDLSSVQHQQQQQQPSPTAATNPSITPTVATSQPSYIVFPQSFQMPQTLTLEQLQNLSATIQHQRQEQLHGQVAASPTQNSGNSNNNIIPLPVRPITNNHHNVNGDEVEEHFARALGEKWHQFKKDGSPPNKIST